MLGIESKGVILPRKKKKKTGLKKVIIIDRKQAHMMYRRKKKREKKAYFHSILHPVSDRMDGQNARKQTGDRKPLKSLLKKKAVS